jgi:polysaccharide biosynthesis transport protein
MMPFDIKFYLSIFWRRFPYFAVIAALIGAIGVSVASVLPSEYRARAVLLIEGEQIPSEMMASTVQGGVGQQVSFIRDRLTSRASMIDHATELGIYRERAGMDPDRIVEDMRRRLRVRTSGNHVFVEFRSEDPQVAADVANHFAAIIERQAIEMRRGAASTTLEFFREEVNRLNREMGIHRARVLDFRMQNRDRLPESLEYRRNRMAALENRITRSEAEEAALIARRGDLIALFEATGGSARN